MKQYPFGPAMVLTLSLAACAHVPLTLPPENAGVLSTLEGTAGKHDWTMPDGRPGLSIVLRLKQPAMLDGKVYRLVQLNLDERWHVGWDMYARHRLKVTCVVGESTMWGYPHLWCNPRHVERVR